jgi:hypothetical protein
MIGSVATTRLVKARWAWSELTSPRFATRYPKLGPDAVRLQGLANRGASFAALLDADMDVLVRLVERQYPGLVRNFDGLGFEHFVCVAWTKQDLLEALALPVLSPGRRRNIPYREFIANPPHMVNGKPDWSDPRVSADAWPPDKPYSQSEPGIAVRGRGRTLLVDGYCRSVIFMRRGTDGDRFLVWVPA